MRPILTRSKITDAVYIVPKYKILEGGVIDAIEKCDVTDQFDAMVEPLRVENERLRKILQEGVSDQLSTCGCCWGGPCEDCDCWVTEHADELRDLGIKVPHEHE